MLQVKPHPFSIAPHDQAFFLPVQPSEVATFLPPKKVFGTAEQQFLTERQQGLEKFLKAILSDPLVSSLIEVKKFLDPVNYSSSFYGESQTCKLAVAPRPP